ISPNVARGWRSAEALRPAAAASGGADQTGPQRPGHRWRALGPQPRAGFSDGPGECRRSCPPLARSAAPPSMPACQSASATRLENGALPAASESYLKSQPVVRQLDLAEAAGPQPGVGFLVRQVPAPTLLQRDGTGR